MSVKSLIIVSLPAYFRNRVDNQTDGMHHSWTVTDEQNALWIKNDTDKAWAKAFYLAAFLLIIITTGVIVWLFDGFSVGSSEMNQMLCKVLTFPLVKLTSEFKRRLVMPRRFADHKTNVLNTSNRHGEASEITFKMMQAARVWIGGDGITAKELHSKV